MMFATASAASAEGAAKRLRGDMGDDRNADGLEGGLGKMMVFVNSVGAFVPTRIARASMLSSTVSRLTAMFASMVFCLGATAAHADSNRLDKLGATAKEAETSLSFDPVTGLVLDAGASRIELHGYAWLRTQMESVVDDETDVNATVPVGRVFLTGSVLESKLHFFAQSEFAAGDVKLLDLFAVWKFSDAVHLRLGQFRTPYSRAFITPLTNLELPTRGLVVDRFGLGRDTGAMVSGDLAGGRFHYDVAVVNGATINNQIGDRDSPAIILRNEIRFGDPVPYDQAPSLTLDDPHGLTIGLGGAYSRRAATNSPNATTAELWNAAVDVAWMHGPISIHAESFFRSSQNSPGPANMYGAYTQLGIFVLPRLLEVGGRAGWVSDGPDVQSYEAFLATYWQDGVRSLGHHLKLVLGYRFDSGDPVSGDSKNRHLVRLQTQLFF